MTEAGDVAEKVDDENAVDERPAADSRTVKFRETEHEGDSASHQDVTNGERASGDDGDVKQTDDDDTEDRDVIPWHHMQLYHLYGDAADYFLYPKFTGTTIQKHVSAKTKLLKGRCDVDSAKTFGMVVLLWIFSS